MRLEELFEKASFDGERNHGFYFAFSDFAILNLRYRSPYLIDVGVAKALVDVELKLIVKVFAHGLGEGVDHVLQVEGSVAVCVVSIHEYVLVDIIYRIHLLNLLIK